MRRFGRRPMAALELLAGAAWAKVIAASNGYLVDRLSRIADGFSTWSTASKPVRMNVAHTGGDHVNEGLVRHFEPTTYMFLVQEADCGTEPIDATNSERSSIRRMFE